MKVIAHRGANRKCLENSWSAFRTAIDEGADRLEFDVRLTKDGEICVMHDDSLARTCSVDLNVSELTRKEIGGLALNNGERVPFLEEILAELLAKVELNIEIKSPCREISEKIDVMLQPYRNYLDKIVVSSFSPEPLLYFSESNPDVQIACLFGRHFKWPEFSTKSEIIFMNRCRAKIIHPWTELVTVEFMDQAKARGWTVNTYSEMRDAESIDTDGVWSSLASLGVDGHCSNYPGEPAAWLRKSQLNEFKT